MPITSVSTPYYTLAPSDTCTWKAWNKSCCLGKIILSVIAIVTVPLELIARLFANIGIFVYKTKPNSSTEVDPTPLKTETNSPPEVDPITQVPFEPGDKLIVINNVQFCAETLAHYLVKNRNDSVVLLEDRSRITLWKNSTEYLALLNNLLPLIKDTALIQGIQMRIDGYPLAKALIQEFNNKYPDFSFMHLLEDIFQKMHQTGGVGASFMTDNQKEGFHAYYRLRNCLPEKIATIIFPFYAYDPGDPYCISSASRVLRGQIERLTLLDLGHSTSSQEAIKCQIEPYIQYFEGQVPSPTLTSQTHWAGTITSVPAKQRVIDVAISVTLRYIPLHQGADIYDGFAFALMEKFPKNEMPSLSIQHPISALLKNKMAESRKRKKIKNHLKKLEPQDSLQLLKTICAIDRDIFRGLREKVQNQLPSNPKDDAVWAEIEKNPSLISSTLEQSKDTYPYLQGLIQQTLGIEIPVSICWERHSDTSLAFISTGDFPQVMRDERDGSFKLLLSAN